MRDIPATGHYVWGMMKSTHTSTYHHISAKDHQRILDHYHLALPLMAFHFSGTPLVYAAYPRGLGSYTVFDAVLHRPPPRGEPTIDVQTAKGWRTYLVLERQTMEHAIEHGSAVEFFGWGCQESAPSVPRFGRILLEPDREFRGSVAQAAIPMRDVLHREGLDAIPLLDGRRGLALWVPIGLSTTYPELRRSMHAICKKTVEQHSDRFSVQPNTTVEGKVHLHVDSNAPGRFSCLPYSLRGGEELFVCTPVRWEELPQVHDGDFTAETFPKRLASSGDIFDGYLRTFGGGDDDAVRVKPAGVRAP
ncbi:MAG TPA: hypothetical protein VF132_10655 [Rudaea sp.]